MNRLLAIVAPLAVLFGALVTVVRADISAEEVRKAIAGGIKYLEEKQHPDGSWPDFLGYHSGTTALCTLALLNAGVDIDDPHMQLALNKLNSIHKPNDTYSVSLQTMVFPPRPPRA